MPATSTLPSETTSASVPRIGPEVMTGEAIRTRSFACPSASAIRCASRSPRLGENHARTSRPSTATGSVSTFPVFSTSLVSQSWSKSWVNRAASSGESTVTIAFSCRDHESIVQFVEPDQTDVPSRITYLWCMRSGTPGMPRVGTSSSSIVLGSPSGGGGTGAGLRWSSLKASRTATPRRAASSSAPATSRSGSSSRRKS